MLQKHAVESAARSNRKCYLHCSHVTYFFLADILMRHMHCSSFSQSRVDSPCQLRTASCPLLQRVASTWQQMLLRLFRILKCVQGKQGTSYLED